MKSLKKNKIRSGAWVLIGALLWLGGCAAKEEDIPMEGEMKITFFDVGKGDAVLIETSESSMLIDSGYDKTFQTILTYLDKQEIRKLDYMVITHFDKDHVGGADRILQNLEVDTVLQPDYLSDAGQASEYYAAMEQKGMEPVLVTETMRLSMDGADILVYPPQQKEYEEEDNDFSLVISMTYQGKKFLFAGDSEKVRLQELLEQTDFDLSHDLLKVPHHGKKEKNSEEFLEAVSPKIAVITCSEEMPPDEKILEILEHQQTDIYLTTEGSVTCLCSSKGLQIVQP